MKLNEAYEIISRHKPAAILHVDHICADPVAHDATHCTAPESERYTELEAAVDTLEALRTRMAGTGGPQE